MSDTNAAVLANIDIDQVLNEKVDVWIRISPQSSGTISYGGEEPDSDYFSIYSEWSNQHYHTVRTLGCAVDSLKRSLEYTGLYTSYLLNQISEKDFADSAKTYAFKPVDCDPNILAKQIGVLINHTTSDFTTSELCEMLQATEDSVTDAIKQLNFDFSIETDVVPSLEHSD